MKSHLKLGAVAAVVVLAIGIAYIGARRLDGLPRRVDYPGLHPMLARELAAAERSIRFSLHCDQAVLRLGELYHANGYTEAARACYTSIIDRQNDPILCYYLADLELESGSMESAAALLSRSVDQAPEYVPAHVKLGDVYYKLGKTGEALQAYKSALQRDPNDAYANLGLARVCKQLGQDEAAKRILERLATARPDFAAGLSLYASTLALAGEEEQAAVLRARIRSQKDLPPPDPWMDDLMLRCYDSQKLSFYFEDYVKGGRAERAEAYLKRIETLEPNSWNPRFLRAFYADRQGRPEIALDNYQRALAKGGDPELLYPEIAKLLLILGREEEALRVASEALESLPNSAPLLVVVGQILKDQGRREPAIKRFHQVLEADPRNALANTALAELYWEMGDRDQALPYLRTVRRLEPTDVPSRALLAQHSLEEGRPADAVEPLREALALDARNADLRSLLSVALLRQANDQARSGDLRGAIARYNQSIEVQPSNLEAYSNKIKVQVSLGDFAAAEATVEKLLVQQPQNPALLLTLGDIQQQAGHAEQARETWKRAKELMDRQGGNAALRETITTRLNPEI